VTLCIGRRPTRDVQDDPGDPPRLLGSQEERRRGHVLGSAQPPHRVLLDQGLALSFRDALQVALGEDGLGRDAVRPDPERRDLEALARALDKLDSPKTSAK
jgi:hypothetical protein